jgi:Selenoprotein, putative
MNVSQIIQLASKFWQYLREVSGENDYTRYCARIRKLGEQPLSARAYYLEQLDRKNARPTRCC